MSSTPTSPPRRFGRIPHAIEHTGMSRSRLYQLAAKNPGLFRKNGSATIVDFSILDAILDRLPIAEIKTATRDPEQTA